MRYQASEQYQASASGLSVEHKPVYKMTTIRLAVSVCILVTIACDVYAEKVDLPPQQLRDTATHVIVGAVVQVYERKDTDKDWATTFYLAEIHIKEIEKGEGIKVGELVYVRYWRRTWVGGSTRPLNTAGHRGLPKSGESLRIYLARNAYDGFGTTGDGGFNVIGANGFEKLKE
jgi:hypothetical protein